MTPQQRQRRCEHLVHLLVQQHGDLHVKLCQQLEEVLPAYVFTDYSLIPVFLSEYCRYHALQQDSLQGRAANQSISYHRTGFLALLLLAYQPDKLKGLTSNSTKRGLLQDAAKILMMTAKAVTLKVPEVIVAFKMYQDFKKDTEALHALILSKYRDDGQ